MKSRKRMFLAVVAVAVLFGAGGFVLGQQLESPEDARAEVTAPQASLIGVPVESVALSNDVVVRGDAAFEGAVNLELDASLGDGTSRVVTGRVPEVDSLVDEGDVVIEVSGRPVFVLEGELPAFREFGPGLEGDDVLQLETALQRLGFLDVSPDRLYGSATEQAILDMYEASGYEARAESAGEESQLEGARDAVDGAKEQLADANDALDDLLAPASLTEQESDAQARQARLDTIDRAQDGLVDAREALDETKLGLPSDQLIVAIDGLQDAEQSADLDAIEAANRALRQAQDADQATLERAEEAVDTANEAVADAVEALADYDRLEAAKDADGTDTSRAEQAVADAEERVAELEADLAELEEDTGVRMPAAEIVFLPELPRTVTSVDVERGDFVTGTVMQISGTEVRITTGVSEANRPLLELGQRVIVDSAQLGIEVDGEISELADRTGTNGVADTRYYMQVTPTGDYSVTEMVGVNFRLQIPLEKSDGEVLAVPNSALFIGADESSRLRVLEDDGETTRIVVVEVGLSDKNNSLVEVTALDGSLQQGDFVVVGEERITGSTEAEADSEGDDADGSGGEGS